MQIVVMNNGHFVDDYWVKYNNDILFITVSNSYKPKKYHS